MMVTEVPVLMSLEVVCMFGYLVWLRGFCQSCKTTHSSERSAELTFEDGGGEYEAEDIAREDVGAETSLGDGLTLGVGT